MFNKYLLNIGFKGHQIISLPGALHVSVHPWTCETIHAIAILCACPCWPPKTAICL